MGPDNSLFKRIYYINSNFTLRTARHAPLDIPAPQRNTRPDRSTSLNGQRPAETVNRSRAPRKREAENEPVAAILQRVSHQHRRDREQSKSCQRLHCLFPALLFVHAPHGKRGDACPHPPPDRSRDALARARRPGRPRSRHQDHRRCRVQSGSQVGHRRRDHPAQGLQGRRGAADWPSPAERNVGRLRARPAHQHGRQRGAARAIDPRVRAEFFQSSPNWRWRCGTSGSPPWRSSAN